MNRVQACEVLGVSPNAAEKEIKAAYKKLAKKHHPDVNGGDDQKFKELGQAYENLTKPQPQQPEFNPFHGSGNVHDFESIFSSMFGMGGGRGGGMGQSIHRVAIDPELLMNGGSFDFTFQSLERVQGGVRPIQKTHRVLLEPDTAVLSRIAVPTGAGQHMFLEVVPGDTKRYRISENINLIENHTIDVFTAMTGGEIEVVAPNRKKVKLKIPAGTQSGSLHRLRRLGLRMGEDMRGDYIVQVSINIPEIKGGTEEEIRQKILDKFLERVK